tara:strand:+ start:548 stop:1045 length:498 start_codon:yes stop_codon:yes gene_type:complete
LVNYYINNHNMTNYYKYLLIIFIIFFVVSCQNKKTFIYKFNNEQWDIQQDTIMFIYNANKVESSYNVSLFFRNNINYPYRNIYMFIDILHNHDIIQTDTLQYAVTDKYGRWYGKGIGDTKDNYFLFEQNIKFQKVGAYTFNITHGMRNNPLIGCEKIGLKISEND